MLFVSKNYAKDLWQKVRISKKQEKVLRRSRYLNAWDRLKGLGMSMRIAWGIVRSVYVYRNVYRNKVFSTRVPP